MPREPAKQAQMMRIAYESTSTGLELIGIKSPGSILNCSECLFCVQRRRLNPTLQSECPRCRDVRPRSSSNHRIVSAKLVTKFVTTLEPAGVSPIDTYTPLTRHLAHSSSSLPIPANSLVSGSSRLCKQGVAGSIPATSTKLIPVLQSFTLLFLLHYFGASSGQSVQPNRHQKPQE